LPNATRARFWTVLLTALGLTLLAAYISLTNGEFDMTIGDVVRTLLRIHPVRDYDLVIFQFRLPRIVIAALVGLGLGMAGAVLQGVTRNGLADPGVLGINAGAGAAIVLFTFAFAGSGVAGHTGTMAVLAMPLFGLVGGLGTALAIYLFSWQNGRLNPRLLILAGIALGMGLSAVSLYVSLRMKPQDFEMATVWLTGTIWNANWLYIVAMLPWLVLFVPVVWLRAHRLDLFQLGEDSATSLGLAAEKEKSLLLLSSIGIVSACVSVSGNIGFVGLMAPHIAKRLVGIHHSRVLPVCGALGMLLVVAADFVARTVFSPVELPVGIVISILGVPYFIFLLFKARA